MSDIVPDQYLKNAVYILETGINPADYLQCSPARRLGAMIKLLYAGRFVPYNGLRFNIESKGTLHKTNLDVN